MKTLILILICVGYLYPQGNTIPRRVDTLETDVDSLYALTDTLLDNANYRWYVDAENGSDANTGKTPAQAFENISKIQSLYNNGRLPQFSTIYLKAGSAWAQSLELGDNYHIKSYGEGERPIISGADTVDNADFVLHADDIYKVTDYKALSTFMVISAFEDGEVLTRVTTLTAMPAGTFAVYNQNTADFMDATWNEIVSDTSHRYTIYIRATDSSDVTANSKVYEITKRGYAVYLQDNCTALGIHTTKQGNRDGSLILGFNAVIDSCTMSWGHKHNCLIKSGYVNNSLFLWNEKPAANGGSGVFVASTTFPERASVEVSNCEFYIKDDDFYSGAITTHSSGNEYPYSTAIFNNNYFQGGAVAIFLNEVENIHITNNKLQDVATGFSCDNTTVVQTVYITGNTIIRDGQCSIAKVAGDAYIEDNKIVFSQSDDASIIKILGTGKTIDITNNIFYKTAVGALTAGVIIWNTRDNNTINLKQNIFYNWGWIQLDSLTTSDVNADSNIYYPFSQIDLANNVIFTSLQEVKDSTTWDDNSLDTDPKFTGSPLDNNWFYWADDAVTLDAGNVPVDYTFTAKDGEMFGVKESYDSLVVAINEKLNAEDIDLISKTETMALLALTTTDTVNYAYYDDATIYDEWKYETDDTLTIMAQYKESGGSWTNLFSSNLVMNGLNSLTAFAVDTIPAESQARFYITAVGDNFNDGWVKLYRRITENIETVWTDTLYHWDFKYNINDVESQQVTSVWNAGIGNKFGVCKTTATETSNAFIYFYTDSTVLTTSKEVRLKYDFYVPASNTGFETAMILLGTPNISLNFYEGSAGRWVSVDTTLTLTSNINQFRIYLAENGQYQNFANGDIWYFDNVMILGKP